MYTDIYDEESETQFENFDDESQTHLKKSKSALDYDDDFF